jgi:hypothetical protein
MTRSPPVDLPARAARWLLLGACVAAACGGRELSLGGDPAWLRVAASGSAGALGAGGVTGGSSDAGGSSGALALGGTGGSGGIGIEPGGGGGSAADGAGGVGDNPYPPVTWQDGQGYRDVCPEHDGASGFTCWHEESGTGTTCALEDAPTCNACSCAIPCEEHADCPPGVFGEPAGCFGPSRAANSCFLRCDASSCPTGMVCSTYPGTDDRVCTWLEAPVGMMPPVK